MASAPVLFSVIEPEDRKVPWTSTKLAVTAKLDDFIRTVVAEIRRLSTRPELTRDLLDCASVTVESHILWVGASMCPCWVLGSECSGGLMFVSQHQQR